MADDEKKYPVPHQPPQVPALPTSAGGFALTRTSRASKDAAFSRAYADQLRAQADSYKAAKEYSDARFEFAVALNRWTSLEEVCQHDAARGFMTRISELKVLALDLETKEINAHILRDAAMLALSAYQPQPPQYAPAPAPAAPAPPARPTGLSPAEVLESLKLAPEFNKPEILQAINYILTARLHEKEQSR